MALTVSLHKVSGVDLEDLPGAESGETESAELYCRVALKQPTRMQFKRSRSATCRGGAAQFEQALKFEGISSEEVTNMPPP